MTRRPWKEVFFILLELLVYVAIVTGALVYHQHVHGVMPESIQPPDGAPRQVVSP